MAGLFAAHRWAFVVILGLFLVGGFLAVAGERGGAAGGWLWAGSLLLGVALGWVLYAALVHRREHGPRSH